MRAFSSFLQVYSGEKNFMFGKQPEPMDGTDGKTWVWVMPSSSARCAQLPRAVDKVMDWKSTET